MKKTTLVVLVALGGLGLSVAFGVIGPRAVVPKTSPDWGKLLGEAADAAAVDYFLKLEGIPGESRDAAHKGEIEIDSFAWGSVNPGVQRGGEGFGGGRGAGEANVADVHFVKKVDKASPALLLAALNGQHHKTAVLTVRKAGPEGPQDYLTLKFEDLLVTSYQTSGTSGAIPTDSFSLNFLKIQVTYQETKEDGTLGPPETTGWDLQKNQQVFSPPPSTPEPSPTSSVRAR